VWAGGKENHPQRKAWNDPLGPPEPRERVVPVETSHRVDNVVVEYYTVQYCTVHREGRVRVLTYTLVSKKWEKMERFHWCALQGKLP